jgi:cell division protein FtsB
MIAIAEFITSFRATVFGLLIFLLYRYIEMVSLFLKYLPLEGMAKEIGAFLVSFVVVFSLLIFSSNLEKFKVNRYDSGSWIKWVLFIFTLTVNGYFWEIWNGDSHTRGAGIQLTILFKVILIVFFSIVDFSLNHLFVSTWKDKQALSQVSFSLSQLKEEESQLQAKVSDLSANVSQLIAKEDPKVCPRCQKEFDNPMKRNGHLRSCKIKIEGL